MDDGTELEGRPRQPLMLKEWLELEYGAELSRDGFSCYPRHLIAATVPRTRSSGCRRSRNDDVIARVSAAVRAALSRAPSTPARQGEAAAALRRSLSTRLRAVGFWKKLISGEVEEMDRPVATCSATANAVSSGRWDGASSPAATSPRRMGRESRQGGGDRAGLSDGGRRGHETVGEECECEATCHLGEEQEQEQEQRLSPVSVMDFQSQDGDDDCNASSGDCDGHSEDEATSPTFERSLTNVRRASQQLLQRIQRFEQLAELDTSSDVDEAATSTTTDDDTSCHVGELGSAGDDEDAERGSVQRHLPGPALPEASSSCPAHCFKKLLEDFFREGLSSCHCGGSDDSDLEMSLLETAKAWMDGRHYCASRSDQVEEIERLGRWRCFREDEHELLSSDVEGGIFCSLMEELVEELC